MSKLITFTILLLILLEPSNSPGKSYTSEHSNYLSQKELQEDFLQFRQILENEHCCLYEYSSKAELDSLFDLNYAIIDSTMKEEDFFRILAPITAKIGCMHTATWMPASFFASNADNMFPLKIKLIGEYVVVTGSYLDTQEIPTGSIILEVNGLSVQEIISHLRQITSADAFNPFFIDAQLARRFSMFYASTYGFPEKYEIKYALPGRKTFDIKKLTPANIESVRNFVFANFNNPLLTFSILEGKNTAVMTVETFIYYSKVEYFKSFMDSCYRLIDEKGIKNLILDLRGNDGGDPYCAATLLSYLQKSPVPYFAEPYGKYADLALPIPLPENHFTGNLYTLLDGSCGSTNGHFCALLKYHKIGKFIGTPGGSTYKCNAGRNTEFVLKNSRMIITVGRNTFSAAVSGMDKAAPIIPDILIKETYRDFLDKRDLYIEKALEQIALDNL